MNEEKIFLDGENLSLANFIKVVRNGSQVAIELAAKTKIEESRAMLEEWIKEEKVVYGITTGFGPFVSVLIPTKYQTELQENLIRSHSANVGPLFSEEETRAAMLLRLNAFAKGYSAIRLETFTLLQEMLNRGVHPCIPQWGSVGASGDLTPSSHIALTLMGEGRAKYKGQEMGAVEALAAAGLQPVKFSAKEGLALINGTTMMTGVGGLQLGDAWNLVKTAEIISALSIEALLGSTEPFLARGHEVKAHTGQIATAKNLRKLLDGSGLVWSKEDLENVQKDLQDKVKLSGDVTESGIHVQNVYSLRATPQILGAVRDALTYVTKSLLTEMNSANDNPLFFTDLNISYQGANFHGQPVSMPLDMLSISLTEIAVLSERRLNKILDSARSGGLSPFLAGEKSGLTCGFEGAQYIPTSLVAECRTLCNPASIQSIPSNGENQDVVSMGLVAARKARDIKERVEYVLAVELLAACGGVEERDLSKLGPASNVVYKKVREIVPSYTKDRVMAGDFEKIKDLIHSGKLLSLVEEQIGSLE